MMAKKKILLLASRPLANDGLTKIEMDVIKSNQQYFDFEVGCCFGYDNKYGDDLKTMGIPCHVLPNKKNPFAYMVAIRTLVRNEKYNIVYIHGNSAMMFLEAIPSKMAGVQVITHCHNTKSDYPLVHYIMKPVFNMFIDRKIGCSSLASKWAYMGRRVITIPNGIETNKFVFNDVVRERVRKELQWDDKRIVGHIGRFNKQKNHVKLLGIFDEMHKMDEEMRLLLVGDGELCAEIRNEISQRHLTGCVKILPFSDKPQDYMQAMDIMVMPSLFEGLCLVAVEAQANGLPVMIDRFFPPETSATTQATILDLSCSDTNWASMGVGLIKRGRKDVVDQIREKKMDRQDMMRSIREVLQS